MLRTTPITHTEPPGSGNAFGRKWSDVKGGGREESEGKSREGKEEEKKRRRRGGEGEEEEGKEERKRRAEEEEEKRGGGERIVLVLGDRPSVLGDPVVSRAALPPHPAGRAARTAGTAAKQSSALKADPLRPWRLGSSSGVWA